MAAYWLDCLHHQNPYGIQSFQANLAADLMGPLPSGEYVLVVVDYYSRYFEVDILTSVTSTKVIESLEKIFCTHGLPQSLKIVNGTQFVSDEFERFLKTNDIEHRTSTPLWPQANGEVERQNRSLLKALRIAKAEKKNIWTEMRKFLRANVTKNQTFSKFRGNSSKINLAHNLMVDRPKCKTKHCIVRLAKYRLVFEKIDNH